MSFLPAWQRTIVDENGNTLPSASIDVYIQDTLNRPALYSDKEGTTPITNPFNADINGFAQFYVIDGTYDIVANSGGSTATWSDVIVGLPLDNILGSVGNLSDTLLSLNLSSAKTAQEYQGEFRYENAAPSTYLDVYGFRKNANFYSGTATSGSLFNLIDTGLALTVGELEEYVIKVTTSGVTNYRWIVGNTATSISFNKPVTVPVDATTTYQISKPRFEKNGYLVEVPSTNVLTYSSDMTTNWIATRATKSTDGTKGADGITDMVKITEDSTLTNTHLVTQSYSWTTGTWTASIDFLAGSAGRGLRLTLGSVAFLDGDVIDIDENYTITTGGTSIRARIKEYHANGGVRIEVTGTCDVATPASLNVQMLNTALGTGSYDGDGTSFIYVQFPQVEALPFATSYVPTTTPTAFTRSADNLSLDFLYNMLNWKDVSSIVIDYDTLGETHTVNRFLLRTGLTTSGYLNIGVGTSGRPNYATAGTADIASNLFDGSQKLNRLVFTNDGTTLLSYIDGVLQADTGTNGTGAETNTAIYIGSNNVGGEQLAGHIKRVRIYGRTLTPEEARIA